MRFLRRVYRFILKYSLVFLYICVFFFLPIAVFAQENSEESGMEISEEQVEEQGEELVEETSVKTGEEQEEEPALELDMDELRRRITGEEPKELMKFSLMDSNVSLFATGYWYGSLQGNAGFSNSPLGAAFASPETPFLFTQEVDLTLSLWINKRWFVEANFVDDSAQNTYRAGYQGAPGEFIQYAGIGNTGLDFPSFPYLDLGGDSPSSFGFYGRFGDSDLNVHTLFRYDSAVREEKVFSGGRERSYSYIQPQNSVRGISFVLPDTDIDSDLIVYIEDRNGALRDSKGRRWRYALPNEYAAGRTQGLLDLSIRPDGMIAVSYSKGGGRPWLFSMGNSYASPGSFLNEVQLLFDGIDLEKYPQCGGNGAASRIPGEILIGGVFALVLREPATFSPFERQNRYEAPSSASEQADLVRFSTGKVFGGFELVQIDNSSSSLDIPLVTPVVSRLNLFELVPLTSGLKQRSPQTRWPLAEVYPEIYLPGNEGFSGDITLRFTNYGGSGGYLIGRDVIPGSIKVWRSGIEDNNFNYNAASGEVTLYGYVMENEIIRITFLKRSEETRSGSVAAGFGAIYRKGESPFSVQAAVGVRWNLTEEDSYTTEDASNGGSVGISAKTAWDYDNFKSHITAGFALDQNDTTGLYRAAGMEGNETVVPLPPETSFLSHTPTTNIIGLPELNASNRADLIYRNYVSNSALGSTIMPIDWNGSTVVSDYNRPYPARDPQIKDTNALVAEFSLNGTKIWSGFETPVYAFSGIFSGASEIEIPYRFYDFNKTPSPNFKLIIQIGALSSEDFAFSENPELILEKELFNGTGFNTDLRNEHIVLTDEDRLKLGDARFLRIIAVHDGTEEINGRVLLSPPIVRGASFRPVTYRNGDSAVTGISNFSNENHVTAVETLEMGAFTLERTYGDTIKRLHPAGETQRVLKIEWKNMETGISAGIDGRTQGFPFADYRELSFFVKGAKPDVVGTLSFIIAAGPESINDRQFEAHIPLSAFREGQWSKTTIRYLGENTGITVDGGNAEGAKFHYRPTSKLLEKAEGKSGYVALFINPENSITPLENGVIYIDEIILEDPTTVYRVNAGAALEYKKPGKLLSIGSTNVLSDFLVSTVVESEFRSDPGYEDVEMAGSVANRTGAEITIFGAKVAGKVSFTAAKDDLAWSADHNISKTIGPLSIKESFFASPKENSARHGFNIGFNSLFYFDFKADANYEFLKLYRKWNLGMGVKPKNEYIPAIAITTQANWTSRDEKIEDNENYAGLWARTWKPLVPDIGGGANNRKTLTQITVTEGTKPVGAVFTFEGKTDYTDANSIIQLENSAFLDIPVALKKSSFNFRVGRTFNKNILYTGEDALKDGEKFFESINDSLPLWAFAPFYSLFAPNLNDAMDKVIDSPTFDNFQYAAFHDHFNTRANLPAFYNPLAFIVPSSAAFRVERVMEQKLDTRSDLLNIGGSLGHSAINMFGGMGYLSLFKFYQSDEFTHTGEAAVILSEYEEPKWKLQSTAGAAFMGFTGSQLKFVNTFTITTVHNNINSVYSTVKINNSSNEKNWTESASLEWTVPTKKSLLSIFYNWAARSLLKQKSWLNLTSLFASPYEQLRKETFEIILEKTEDNFRKTYVLGHESIIRILGRLNFTTFVKLRYNEDELNEIYTFDALLGITLRISF